MAGQIKVYVYADETETATICPNDDGVAIVAAGDSSVSETTAETLNRLIDDANAEFVAFTDYTEKIKLTIADFKRAARLLDDHSICHVALLPWNTASELAKSWQRYPARLASLVSAPEADAGLIFRVSAFQRNGRFEDCPAPIWDWIIRSARDGQPVTVVDAENTDFRTHTSIADLPVLLPGQPALNKAWLISHLHNVRPEELVPNAASADDAVAVQAGLLQRHGDLDASHKLSQSVEGRGCQRSGDYWHGIMHRREPDYSNAKYWFRRVGQHSIFQELAQRATDILDRSGVADLSSWHQRLGLPNDWNPFAFVDLCEDCARCDNPQQAQAAREIQRAEMQLLLAETYNDARRGS